MVGDSPFLEVHDSLHDSGIQDRILYPNLQEAEVFYAQALTCNPFHIKVLENQNNSEAWKHFWEMRIQLFGLKSEF